MKYLDSFTNNNYKLTKGRLLTTKDQNTNNCVIETNLASDNDLSVGDTFTITTTVNDETITQELTIVGIYEIQSTNEIGGAHFNNPVNTNFILIYQLDKHLLEVVKILHQQFII